MVPCEVCCRAPAQQLLPERTPRELSDGWTYHELCVVCLDQVLYLFPFRPHMLTQRELTGRFLRGPKGSAKGPPSHKKILTV